MQGVLREGKTSYRGFPQMNADRKCLTVFVVLLRAIREHWFAKSSVMSFDPRSSAEIRGKILLIVQTHVVLLLGPQRHQWIDTGGAPGRQVAGKNCCHSQQQENPKQS